MPAYRYHSPQYSPTSSDYSLLHRSHFPDFHAHSLHIPRYDSPQSPRRRFFAFPSSSDASPTPSYTSRSPSPFAPQSPRLNSSTDLVRGELSSGNDESTVCCSICMNPYSAQGDHQVSCLPCGHLYGLSCIRRWIKHSKQRYSKCPLCNQMCSLKDVVKLYVPWLPVVERGKQESSVSNQPQDDLYKVRFAKFEEELANIKSGVMTNSERSERIEKFCMQYESTQKTRRSFDEELAEIKEDFQKKFEDLNKTIDLKSEQQNNKIDAFFRRVDDTLCNLRTVEKQKHEIEEKDRKIKELTMSLERQDVQIHQMKKRRKP
ncbi:hypothetical protein MKW94_005214 [Papaver nudicaule]|uniref:RING-type domain-containing protein n=1 Tax=Papaver nudicaule TaxID=74823 RepID=A0AA41VYF5_PAPNU|nr:hypothetical protein [Papaver nudicaule]